MINFRFYDWLYLRLFPNLSKHLNLTLAKHLTYHSHSFYQDHFSGSLASKVSDIETALPLALKTLIDRFFSHGLGLLFAIYTVYQANPRFSVGLFLWAFTFMVIAIKSSQKGQALSAQASQSRAQVIGQIVDMVTNMMNVRLFSSRKFEERRLEKACLEAAHKKEVCGWFFMKTHFFLGISFIIFQGVCFYWLVRGFQNGSLTPGDFALIMTLNIYIIETLWAAAMELQEFSENLGRVRQGIQTLLVPFQIPDRSEATPLNIREASIIFERVSFSYVEQDCLFKNLSLRIAHGQKVGLVGYSGSGKSTFVNLILRLFEVDEGRILVDDQNIQDVTQDSLRENIGMIPQDPSLFHRTLMENIRYGCLEATDEEVLEASKRAHAHEFIEKLPQGYDSLVGERGVKLSGGQRQRIAIARAILKNAPILILDEATSQLDSSTESKIQSSLWDLMQDKTTIIIAHRLSTLLHMDRILVFDQGKIVQDGPHDELLVQDGLYKVLWNTQVGGFLPDSKQKGIP